MLSHPYLARLLADARRRDLMDLSSARRGLRRRRRHECNDAIDPAAAARAARS
jgi:hypothetical protein